MATTILASGTSSATSSNVTVAAGSVATVGIFATGAIPAGVQCSVTIATPGDDASVTVLNSMNPATAIAGPGTFRVKRPDVSSYEVSIGAYSEP